MFLFGIAIVSINLILSIAPSPVPDDTALCNIVTFPDQCQKTDDDKDDDDDDASDYDYYSAPSNSNCSSSDCQSSSSSYGTPSSQYDSDDMNSNKCDKSCDCSPCQYTCHSILSTGLCACILQEEDNSCSIGQVSLFGYSVTDHSILLVFATYIDAKANDSIAIHTYCINPTTGYWHNNTLLINQDIAEQYQYNVTDLLPSTVYTCCARMKYSKTGPLACLNISTAVAAPSQIPYPIVYGIEGQRISATSVGIELNTSSLLLSADIPSLIGCQVSYGNNTLNKCHQWSMPRDCSSVLINQTLILTKLNPKVKYCINVTILYPDTDSSTFISYADIYENSPVRLVLSPGRGGGIDCLTWIHTQTLQKLSDITMNLINEIHITEDYVLYKYFEACSPQNEDTEYVFRCSIIGYNSERNSTILAEEVRDRLEGEVIVVAGVETTVSKVCLGGLDCQPSMVDDGKSDDENMTVPTSTSILSGVVVLLALLVIVLIAIGLGIRLRKTIIQRKCRSKDNDDQIVLTDADSTATEYATVLHRSPPPYPSMRNSAASMIEEVYDVSVGVEEDTKADFLYSQINDYVGFTRGSVCDDQSLMDIETTSNPGYSINDNTTGSS